MTQRDSASSNLPDCVKDFTEFIKNQIEYFSLPLNEIYSRYTFKNSLSVTNIIEQKDVTSFSNEINQEINATFIGLGIGFKKEQLMHLEYLNKRLTSEIEKCEREYAQKVKIFRALSIFTGCCAVILFV